MDAASDLRLTAWARDYVKAEFLELTKPKLARRNGDGRIKRNAVSTYLCAPTAIRCRCDHRIANHVDGPALLADEFDVMRDCWWDVSGL